MSSGVMSSGVMEELWYRAEEAQTALILRTLCTLLNTFSWSTPTTHERALTPAKAHVGGCGVVKGSRCSTDHPRCPDDQAGAGAGSGLVYYPAGTSFADGLRGSAAR